jgi:hypothetical protein
LNRSKVFDPIRKKYVVLTPEELVRQGFLNYLINSLNYPSTNIAVEVSLKVNTLLKRCDILIYNKYFQPVILVECKANSVALNQSVMDQIVLYNQHFKLSYLIVTNSVNTYICLLNQETKTYQFMNEFPKFENL